MWKTLPIALLTIVLITTIASGQTADKYEMMRDSTMKDLADTLEQLPDFPSGHFTANVSSQGQPSPPTPPLVFLPILLFNMPNSDVVCRCWSAEDVAEWVGLVDVQLEDATCDIYDEDGSRQYGNFGWESNVNMMTASDDYSTNPDNPGACWYERDGSTIQHFPYITQAEVDACGRLLDDGIMASTKCNE